MTKPIDADTAQRIRLPDGGWVDIDDAETARRTHSALKHVGYIEDVGGYSIIPSKGGGAQYLQNLNGPSRMLAIFLNDKAQTGARIADLAHVDIEHCAGGWRIASHNGAEQKRVPFDGTYHETADEAIAALWLRAHNLPDPRKEVKA